MEDDSCLVACDGLYADVTDDSLQQKVVEGIIELGFLGDLISYLTFFQLKKIPSVMEVAPRYKLLTLLT